VSGLANALQLAPDPLREPSLEFDTVRPSSVSVFHYNETTVFKDAIGLLRFFFGTRRPKGRWRNRMAFSARAENSGERYQRLTGGASRRLARLIMDGQDDTLTPIGHRGWRTGGRLESDGRPDFSSTWGYADFTEVKLQAPRGGANRTEALRPVRRARPSRLRSARRFGSHLRPRAQEPGPKPLKNCVPIAFRQAAGASP